MVAITGAIAGAIGAAAPTIGALAGAHNAVQSTQAMHRQEGEIKKQQATEQADLDAVKADELKERKSSIDLMRRQLLGSGESQTMNTGVINPARTMSMEVLG